MAAISKTRTHTSSRRRPNRWLVTSVLARASTLALATSANAQTLPTGGTVAAGSATIATSGSTTTVTQTSSNAVINWSSFSVGQGAAVTFDQPNTSSATLNRVTGDTTSVIAGTITATGTVYLVNPNGISITSTGTVQTGGSFVASTLNITDDAFMAGNYTFTGTGASKTVSNAGSITAGSGAYVALLGGAVSNSGTITVPLGKLAMGSGEQVVLDINGDNFLQVAVPTSLVTGDNALVDNSGTILVSGGTVELKAAVLKDAVRNVINMSGTINVDSAVGDAGTIRLIGGSDTDNMAGTVTVSGTLSAQATGSTGNGGTIETSGEAVNLSGITVSTLAANGATGTWIIDPTEFTVAASGGDITGDELSTNLASTNVTIKSSDGTVTTGNDGDGSININDDVSWSTNKLTLDAYGDININATLTASGTAGFAAIVGDTAQNGTGSDSGSLNFGLGSSGFYGTLNIASTGSFSLNGQAYTIITTLGAQGSTTGTDLQGINGDLDGYYVLGSDIDASATASWNGGAGFTSIGTSSSSFTGSFLGLGHTISNLTIKTGDRDDTGLFGYTGSSATISAVGLIDASITGTYNAYYVGALVGKNAGTISQSYATGKVTGVLVAGGLVGYNIGTITDSYATSTVAGSSDLGGLVGYNTGTISQSYATGAVTGSFAFVGGLVGYNYGTINQAYATGAVSGVIGIGGLVGYNSNASTISQTYATGSVSGSDYVGGLAGYNLGTISQSYATGVTSASTDVGGLVGINYGTIKNSYWDSYATGQSGAVGQDDGTQTNVSAVTSDPAQSGTTTYAYSASAYSNFTSDDWVFIAGVRPMGAWEQAQVEGGTAYISNSHQLQLIAASSTTLGQNYVLVGDLDMSETGAVEAGDSTTYSGMWSGAGFVPIGTLSVDVNSRDPFTGSFDGNGHTLSNLTINSDSDSAGLFGYTSSTATISAVGLVNASISSTGDYVGALVGVNEGTISQSYATGTVTGNNTVGGLAAYNSGTITGSYATGSVTGSDEVGGLVGENFGAINQSYATGAVTGDDIVGGLVGLSFNGSISESFATGAVSGVEYVGGLVGYNTGTIKNSYWDSYATGQSSAVGIDEDGTLTNVSAVTSDPTQSSASNYAYNASAWSYFTTNDGSSDVDTVGGQDLTWRIYDGYTYPLLKTFLTTVTLSASTVYNGTDQSPSLTMHTTDGSAIDSSLIYGTESYSCSGGVGACTSVGEHTMAVSGLYSSQQGYDIVSEATLTITPASLTITGNTSSSTYTGSAQSNGYTVTGLLGSDSVTSVSGSASGTSVGTYTDSLSAAAGTGLSNYTITYVNGSLVITPASLTITGDTSSSTYAASAQSNGYTVTGLLGSDSVTSVNGSASGTRVGTYADILNTAVGSGLSNYTITYVNGSLVITQAVWATGESKASTLPLADASTPHHAVAKANEGPICLGSPNARIETSLNEGGNASCGTSR